MANKHKVVILGGGFGGLQAARALKGAPAEVTLVDRRNFHLFQPLLYQVATGGLSPANIAYTLRNILRSASNVHVIMEEATGFDIKRKKVLLANGEIGYDTLVLATGSSHHYFGNEGWAELAPGLKTVEDALEIRRRVLSAFEAAERSDDPADSSRLLTFVVIGGGPTGVELAGALAEISRDTLLHEFRRIDTSKARIVLIEGADHILQAYPADLSKAALAALRKLGVEVRLGHMVRDIDEKAVSVEADGRLETIAAGTVLWAAGVRASNLGLQLASAAGADTDSQGRIVVEPDCSVPGYPEIHVIGDLARFSHGRASPLPGVAPVAMQQGRFVAKLIRARLAGKVGPRVFRYRDYGSMATIGRSKAVADFGRVHLKGYPAWLAWLFIHLMKIVQFQDRLLVLVQWAWNYVTYNRYARLITSPWRSDTKKSEGPPHGSTMEEDE